MAGEEQEQDEVVEEKGGSKKIIIIAGGVLALLIIVGATLFFTGFFDAEPAANPDDPAKELTDDADDESAEGEDAAGEEGAPPVYLALKPPFMVNFQNTSIRVMKVSMSVMARDEAALDAVKLHDPVIRNNILLLLSDQNVDALKTTKGKTALQTAVLDDINKVLKERKVKSVVEAVFFTELVMQ
ncbi:MAG: flagellar basal body-associated protein FliL [Piscirickettsiaceae bacterium]|nr:MAG: flagellar basal body-associated protein FliL [Piscirickettsiaceae bacterium]